MSLVTHQPRADSLAEVVDETRRRLRVQGDTRWGPVAEKLHLLDQLTEFEFGRHLLQHRSLSGTWTHFLSHEYPRLPEAARPAHPLARRMCGLWNFVGLRERVEIVHRLIQPRLRDNIALLSVPCGVMAELSALDYGPLRQFQLHGIDLDQDSLDRARGFAVGRGLSPHVSFSQQDAWEIAFDRQFDIVVSLGLASYVREADKLLDLYRRFLRALVPGGRLLVSYFTPPVHIDPASERDVSSVAAEDLRFYEVVYQEILQIGFHNFASSAAVSAQLRAAGFARVTCHYSTYRHLNLAEAERA